MEPRNPLQDDNLGFELVQVPVPEGIQRAARLIDDMFLNDPRGRQEFLDASLNVQPHPLAAAGHSADCINATFAPKVAKFERSVTALLPLVNANPAQSSPLLALDEKVKSFFKCGPDAAAFLFLKLQRSVMQKSYKSHGQLVEIVFSFDKETSMAFCEGGFTDLLRSCKMPATLILLFACSNDPECLHASVKMQSHSLKGIPTLELIQKTPSASLLLEFRQAKAAALNQEKTTILSVTLVDVHIFELAQREAASPYASFAHVFTMGVGPEGAMVWQAWRDYGYRIDEYVADGHARLRGWDEADQFVRDFEKLVSGKGSWDAKANKLYKKLFHVDINKMCGPNGPDRPVTPKFKCWVRVHTIKDVSYENITKLQWTKEELPRAEE